MAGLSTRCELSSALLPPLKVPKEPAWKLLSPKVEAPVPVLIEAPVPVLIEVTPGALR